MKISRKTTLLIALFGMASAAWSQPTPAQIHMQQQQQNQNLGGMIQSDNMRRCGNPNGCARVAPQGPSAAEVRAWHERERKVQAEIAKHKATLYYRAIAYDFGVKAVVWGGGGYYSEKKAADEALKGCRSSNCHLVTAFFNNCAMVAFPAGGAKTPSEVFVGLDKDGYQAIVKSVRACEAKHGYGNCRYSDIQTQSGDVACTGYDYSIYGQQ